MVNMSTFTIITNQGAAWQGSREAVRIVVAPKRQAVSWKSVAYWTGWLLLLAIPIATLAWHEVTVAAPSASSHEEVLRQVDADHAKTEAVLNQLHQQEAER